MNGDKTSRPPAIEDHGVIGDLRTVALVATDGTLDWWCFPHFDSPSVFAALLDPEKGGHFRISPELDGQRVVHKQFYWPDSNVLVTRFYSPEGVGELVDFMPLGKGHRVREVVRRIRAVRGEMAFRLECLPAFNYARDPHTVRLLHGGASFLSATLNLTLSTSARLETDGQRVTSRFTLSEGQSAVFSLREGAPELVPRNGDGARGLRGAVPLHGGLLAALARGLQLHGAVARDGASLGAGAEADDVRALGGHRRGAHLQPARVPRRPAQLGLPLRVDSRRGLHGVRADAHRLQAGGGRVHALAGEAHRGAAAWASRSPSCSR